jgi:hypothetical protein
VVKFPVSCNKLRCVERMRGTHETLVPDQVS